MDKLCVFLWRMRERERERERMSEMEETSIRPALSSEMFVSDCAPLTSMDLDHQSHSVLVSSGSGSIWRRALAPAWQEKNFV
mmetsp:Transcript_14805/g.14913  ORF Transcript_14805/g.14913 Transcript_14805/m.14913 type:complete len:82 (-) Transcript_14805:172-417(-)